MDARFRKHFEYKEKHPKNQKRVWHCGAYFGPYREVDAKEVETRKLTIFN